MTELLSLSRAARLAGVTRAELQKRIRGGELETFEGKIAVSDLLRLYPEVNLDRSAILERVALIKETATPRLQQGDTVLPDSRVLVSRLQDFSELLLKNTTALHALEAILEEVGERLAGALAAEPPRMGDALRELSAWLARSRAERDDRSDAAARLFAKDAFLRIMAANVTIIPSGHEFFVEGSESILDASVRAGLNLSYGCSSGNCGSCKARVVSGRIWKMRDHDYVLSERERSMGYILTCSNTAVTDVMLEAAEALSVADLPQQEIRATLRKVEPLAADLRAIQVQTPRTQTLRFMAGQRVRLALEPGEEIELHIASCPCDGRNLQFYLRRDPSSRFARKVFSGLRPHGLVTLSGPYGRFVLEDDRPDPTVFIAFGEGIAPMKSLIEHAVSIDIIEFFSLYWVVAEGESHYLEGWCRSLRDALDNFRYLPFVGIGAQGLIHRLRDGGEDLTRHRFYVAGPARAVEEATEALVGLGIDPERVVTETLGA